MDELKKLRQKIDSLDSQLLALIETRINIVKKIKQVKQQNNLNIKDELREDKLLQNLIMQGETKGIRKEIITKIWKSLFELSYEIEKGEK